MGQWVGPICGKRNSIRSKKAWCCHSTLQQLPQGGLIITIWINHASEAFRLEDTLVDATMAWNDCFRIDVNVIKRRCFADSILRTPKCYVDGRLHIGRIVRMLKAEGAYENTLSSFRFQTNGCSGEMGVFGTHFKGGIYDYTQGQFEQWSIHCWWGERDGWMGGTKDKLGKGVG